LLGPLDADALDTLDGVAGVDSGSGLVSVELRHLGGALATPPAGAGALSHISAPYVLNAVGAAHDPEMYGATFAELGGVVDAMAPWDAGSYLNFVERPTSSVFDRETAARLGAVKAAFDPDRIFTLRSGL
jgi:hypothetical protein